MLDGKIEYWARFSTTDDEDEDYTDYVQVTGDNLGKVFYDSEQACFNVSGFYDGLQDYPTMAFSECANIGMEVIGNIHEMNTEEIK